MINLVDLRRKHTQWSIKQNATDITINRETKEDVGGYFEENETILDPQTVRIFVSKANTNQTVVTLAGQKQVDRYFGLLADHKADLKADTHTTDQFELDGMTFVIKAVYPQTINSQLVGYQCELERVK